MMFLFAVLLSGFATSENAIDTTKRRNVLFIVVDDMRPSLGAFNFSLAYTPNMDKLASEGLTFKRTYVQYAFCAPSRNSFMSGRRPDTTRVWNFRDHFREKGIGDKWASLPEYFKRNGYNTLGSGKLFHPGVPPDKDYNRSFSHEWPYFSPECTPPKCPSSSARGSENGIFHCIDEVPERSSIKMQFNTTSYLAYSGGTYCPANTSADETRPEYQLEDQKIRDSCISQLHIAKKEEKNFFVGCGFHKPHVPWIFPQEFLEHFPANLDDVPLARDTHAPIGMPEVAWHYPADVKGMDEQGFNGSCNATRSRIYRRGYYASVAYTDYNIGKVLDALDSLGLAGDTVVLVFGDHGWQLGEHATWAKMTNFEIALRTPTIIRAPWMKSSAGRITNVLAEAVDFYPTLAALAGLPSPRSVGEEVNGTSLIPVFLDPSDTSFKKAAFSQFAKGSREHPFDFWPTPERNATEIMGYSVRVERWRYTAWFGFNGHTVAPLIDTVLGRELYDHEDDDGDADFPGENINVVDHEDHGHVVAQLHNMILDYIQLFPVTSPEIEIAI